MDGSKFNQTMQTVGASTGIVGSLIGAYFNVPKAISNENWLRRANTVGQTRYGASNASGLMSQWETTPQLQNATYKDFYNPSNEEMFSSMLGAGIGAYNAAQNLTSSLKGSIGTVKSEQIPQGQVSGDIIYTGGNAMNNSDFSKLVMNGGQKEVINPISVNTSGLKFNNYNCGGHLHNCGGHKFVDGGAALSTGLNLLTGGLGVALNYAGIKEQMAKADMEANEVNATNLYARQLQKHNFDEAVNDTKNNMFRQQALQMMAMGGDLHTNGSDFPLNGDYNFIGAGGTHEKNPFGGVFQGIAVDGKPNLVEENEVVWNDYVFSNRIPIPDSFAKEHKLKKGLTYSEAAQKLSKEAEERPNDPISQNGLTSALDTLMQSQEEVKMKREGARIKREISKMSPEEIMQLMQAIQTAQTQPQQPQQYEQPQQLQQTEQLEQPQIAAEGGHLFPWGGTTDMLKVSPPYQKSNFEKYIPYIRELTKEMVKQKENDPIYKAWTKYVNDNWDTPEVQEYLKALDEITGGNHLFDKEGKILPNAKDYFNNARIDGKWGYYHLTPNQIQNGQRAVIENVPVEEVVKSDEQLQGDNDNLKEIIQDAVLEEAVQDKLPTWMRYAPVLGSALGAITASAPAKDYSTSFVPRYANYVPIGDYLPYMPIDTQRYINAENQQAAAQLNAIMNASAGNRNMAMAQAALANHQRQQGIGQRMQAAEQINWDRLRTAGEFNRGTNMFNAQAHNQAELANLQNNPHLLHQEQQNATMRHAVDSERDAAISASLNALFDNLGDIGRENLVWNQANSNKALGYFSDPNWFSAGNSHYKKPTTGNTKTNTINVPLASFKKNKR